MSTAVCRSGSARMRSAARRPSSSGIRMSISTTSGRRRRTTSTAARPSPASPTTCRSGSASRITRNPARSSAWSSAITTLISVAGAGSGAASPGWRTVATVTGSPTPGIRSAPAGRRWPATRRPATWRTTSETRISPAPAASHRPARHDHRRAVEVVALAGRLARVEAGAHGQLPGLVAQLDRAAQRLDGARERGHEPAAGAAHLAAAVGADAHAHALELLAPHGVRRLVAQAPEQRRRAHELGHEDRHERRLHPRSIIVARRGRVIPDDERPPE